MPPFNTSRLNSTELDILNITELFNITDINIEYSQSIGTAPVYLFCCALSLAGISAFLRAGFVLKFISMIVCVIVQGCVLSLSKLYIIYDHEEERLRFEITNIIIFTARRINRSFSLLIQLFWIDN